MGHLCPDCRQQCLALRRSSVWETTLWTVGTYDGLLKQCITSVKTRGHKALAKELVGAVAEIVSVELAPQLAVDAIFSVPSSQQGQRFRGFSLPGALEAQLVQEVGWKALPVELRRLYRSTAKTSQGLTAGQRIERAQSLVKEVKSEQTDLGTILLIDDVVTTGSTLGRCVKEARAQGFSRVVCLALAESPLH